VAIPVSLSLCGLGVGVLLERTLLTRLRRAAARTPSPADDLVLAALRGPLAVVGAVVGLYVGLQCIELSVAAQRVAQRLLVTLTIASVSWTLARLVADLLRVSADARAALRSAPLIPHLAKALVLILGGLTILQTLGISITPLITALGVGGIAVGLALQDSLANLFAGIHLLLSRQVRPGDFVRLSSGEEGYVRDVTWRYTTIHQLPNNVTVVPNVKLASAVTANFNLPDPEQAVLVEAGVAYDSDLNHVERVTVAVGREVMRQVEGGVPPFEPFIRYHTFGDSAILFTVILRGRDYVSQYLIKHEFIKRLHDRYRRERIEIPFPMRTVRLQRVAAPPPP
jgi:small-conductance mechanosensitive channel